MNFVRNGTGSVVRVRACTELSVDIQNNVPWPTRIYSFDGLSDSAEHVAVGVGDWCLSDAPLVRIHSECLTGDVFSSMRCDCGAQLRESLQIMTKEGGIVLYMRQEGRGIGLYRKLDAYVLQDEGADTYSANVCMNLPPDGRSYRSSAEMLRALNVRRVRLLSNNPDKLHQLERYGIEVTERMRTGVFLTPTNARYLRTKVQFAGHLIHLPDG